MEIRIEKTQEQGGFRFYDISVDGLTCQCAENGLPDGDDRTYLYLLCRHGVMTCKGFDPVLMDNLGHAHCAFSAGVPEDLLNNRPVRVNDHARSMGIDESMTGLEIYRIMNGA